MSWSNDVDMASRPRAGVRDSDPVTIGFAALRDSFDCARDLAIASHGSARRCTSATTAGGPAAGDARAPRRGFNETALAAGIRATAAQAEHADALLSALRERLGS
jgi:hypothetical protein